MKSFASSNSRIHLLNADNYNESRVKSNNTMNQYNSNSALRTNHLETNQTNRLVNNYEIVEYEMPVSSSKQKSLVFNGT
jgi:hypothetical protein